MSSFLEWTGMMSKKEDTITAGATASSNLSDPTVIWSKINAMYQSVQDRLPEWDEEKLPGNLMQVSFLAMLRFQDDLEKSRPSLRSEIHRREGDPVANRQVAELAYWLEFAAAAYFEGEGSTHKLVSEVLQPNGYQIIRHHNFPEPGRVGHFIAVNHEAKIVVVSLKGTSSLSDVLTDVMAKATEQELPFPLVVTNDPENTVVSKMHVHEAMGAAAVALADDIQHMIELLFMPQGFKIVICGHSLGAGVACLLGIHLRSRIPQLRQEKEDKESPPRLVVHAFATPAVLDLKTALACQSFIISVVNNDDVVPRASLVNFVTLLHILEIVATRLKERNMDFHSMESANTLATYLLGLDKKSSEFQSLFTLEETFDLVETLSNSKRIEEEGSLVVPGRIVYFWNLSKPNATSEKEEGTGTEASYVAVDARVLNARMLAVQMVEISENMIADHDCTFYRATFQNFLKQPPTDDS